MICKNCNTAVEEDDKVCKNCGAPLKNNRKWGLIAAILIIAAILAVYFLSNNNKDGQNNVASPMPAETESQAPVQTQPTETAIPSPKPTPEEIEEPIPTSEANLEMPIDDVWEMIDDVVINIDEYYAKYSETVTYLSKNGYLFEDPSKSYIFVQDMDGLVDVKRNYVEETIMFFYIRPFDLADVTSVRVTNSDELKIFAGYETKEGFAIAASGEQGGIISRENLKTVLDKYSWNHGEMRKVDFQSDQFELAIKAIASYTANTDGFDVRQMRRDDKYIVVVASPKGKPLQINQFVLEDSGDIFSVKIGNLEAFHNYKVVANTNLPDFNIELLPKYNLAEDNKYLASDCKDIIEAMKSSSLITESDLPSVFESGTSDFVYFEFTSGKRFVGHLEPGSWKLYPVETYELASDLMLALDKKAPLFILKQY